MSVDPGNRVAASPPGQRLSLTRRLSVTGTLGAAAMGAARQESVSADGVRLAASPTTGFYEIEVQTNRRFTVTGTTAIWSPDGPNITLGPDESASTAAQVILTLTGRGTLVVTDALLSTTDEFRGTGEAINGRTYHAASPASCGAPRQAFYATTVTRERIEGGFCFELTLVAPEEGPPTARISGTFVAIEP